MRMSDSIASIATALAEFQSIVNNVSKSSTNPAFRSKYASLDDIITTIRPSLKKCGLSFVQNPHTEGNAVGVCTLLLHSSGEYMYFDPVMITLADKGNAGHQVGSAMTYARRFSLTSALGIASEEDTDGNGIDPSPRKQTTYTNDSSPKYGANKKEAKPLPQAWNELAVENRRSEKPTGLDSKLEMKRFFAICGKKNLTDKQQKAVAFLYTGKLSRKDVTPEEYAEINRNIQDATEEEIYHMIVQALKMFKKGEVANG